MNLIMDCIIIVPGAILLSIVFLMIERLRRPAAMAGKSDDWREFLKSGRVITYLGTFALGAIIIVGGAWPVLFVPLSSDQFANVLGIFGLGLTIMILSSNALQDISSETETEKSIQLLTSIHDILDRRLHRAPLPRRAVRKPRISRR